MYKQYINGKTVDGKGKKLDVFDMKSSFLQKKTKIFYKK